MWRLSTRTERPRPLPRPQPLLSDAHVPGRSGSLACHPSLLSLTNMPVGEAEAVVSSRHVLAAAAEALVLHLVVSYRDAQWMPAVLWAKAGMQMLSLNAVCPDLTATQLASTPEFEAVNGRHLKKCIGCRSGPGQNSSSDPGAGIRVRWYRCKTCSTGRRFSPY